ncbi:dihydrofolate reductase [Candidatus Enterococcus murrayae]|uniref:Dihydrofolate reductase n=1 Tax=Candidatus Enterococcus murrayae TaxID=2815321 RepID=A0ABS3HG05_9ENTE|nr:dihydrofolate reductase [Enterococcus sp. MJM16]MBO0452198.1 dihydrofolate reductase [Enterococcus sp. MJM16]
MLIAIWAQDKNGLIGKNNHLPWHLPNDLRFFKETTLSHTLVMGRKTFEGMGGRPLPDRKTIVLTRDMDYHAENIIVMHSLGEVLAYDRDNKGKTFIAGGSAIYTEFLPYCEKIYRTFIEASFEGDAYFPTVLWNKWQLLERKQGKRDEKNPYRYYFETYGRTGAF